MTEKIFKATHTGELKIGDVIIDCAVLEDGSRVLSERAVSKAFGAKRGGAHWRRKKAGEAGADLPVYASATNLLSFITKDLDVALKNPVKYRYGGGHTANGLPAQYLPEVCNIWLKVRDADKLHPSQLHLAVQADMLMRGLATVGIIALVDEATGYQELRDKKALAAILDKYLRKELAAWAKKFPDEFYMEMFRLRNWPWNPVSVARPSVVGKYTNDLVYERLAPKILDELQKRNPKNESGNRANKHHQWLTEDLGDPALAQHIFALIALMKASTSWDGFYRSVQRALPKKNEQMPLLIED